MSIRQPRPIEDLLHVLARLPGIGPRSAQRIASYLLQSGDVPVLMQALKDVHRKIHPCPLCNSYTDQRICAVCNDPRRQKRLLCVVESIADQYTLDQTMAWGGRYFVLHGRLNPLEGVDGHAIGLDRLLERIAQRIDVLQRVVIATSYTPEGDATAYYIIAMIQRRWPELRVTRLARGLPSGIEIEYTDLHTIANAVYDRKPEMSKEKE